VAVVEFGSVRLPAGLTQAADINRHVTSSEWRITIPEQRHLGTVPSAAVMTLE
jgi:hypothetical protein